MPVEYEKIVMLNLSTKMKHLELCLVLHVVKSSSDIINIKTSTNIFPNACD